jgi:hypothetical protein
MKKTFFATAVVASTLVLGTAGLALAQQGLSNVPADSPVVGQSNDEGATSTTDRTTGYSDRSDRDLPPNWRVQERKPSEPLLPRH